MKKVIFLLILANLFVFSFAYAQDILVNRKSANEYEIAGFSTQKYINLVILDTNDQIVDINQVNVTDGQYLYKLKLDVSRVIGAYKVCIAGNVEQTFSVTDDPILPPKDAELASSLEEALIILNSANRESILRIIEKNNSLYGLNLSSNYSNLTQTSKDYVLSGLLFNNFHTKEELNNEFVKLVDQMMNLEIKPHNSGSGGSKGGMTITLPETVVQDTINEVGFGFLDIDTVPWAKDSILNLATKGIVSGKQTNMFYPNDNVTREEFCKIIVNAFYEVDALAVMEFDDVGKSEWYYPYVATAVKKGLIYGTDNNKFGTNECMTRQDLATIVYRIMMDKNFLISDDENDATSVNESDVFKDDSEISEYAKTPVKVLSSEGIINGYDNYFEPYSFATRAQVAKIINSVIKRLT